jgi:RimJ/RimL family protein N-acetyltransferase
VSILTPRLVLLPASLDDFLALGESEAALAARLGVSFDPDWLGFPDARAAVAGGAEHLSAYPEDEGWWTYWFVLRAENRLIGMGGYKGAPHQGGVEIGYTVSSHYRGQGLASEAAQGMIDHAFGHPPIAEVRAHTLPQANASTRILEKMGMSFAGEVQDPEDGPVWRWTLARPVFNPS